MIRFQCPDCKKVLNAPAKMAGTAGRCPQCRGSIKVPAATATATENPPPPDIDGGDATEAQEVGVYGLSASAEALDPEGEFADLPPAVPVRRKRKQDSPRKSVGDLVEREYEERPAACGSQTGGMALVRAIVVSPIIWLVLVGGLLATSVYLGWWTTDGQEAAAAQAAELQPGIPMSEVDAVVPLIGAGIKRSTSHQPGDFGRPLSPEEDLLQTVLAMPANQNWRLEYLPGFSTESISTASLELGLLEEQGERTIHLPVAGDDHAYKVRGPFQILSPEQLTDFLERQEELSQRGVAFQLHSGPGQDYDLVYWLLLSSEEGKLTSAVRATVSIWFRDPVE